VGDVGGVCEPGQAVVGYLDHLAVCDQAVSCGQVPVDDVTRLEVLHASAHVDADVEETQDAAFGIGQALFVHEEVAVEGAVLGVLGDDEERLVEVLAQADELD